MTDKNLLLKALSKCYVVITTETPAGITITHATLNKKIIAKVCKENTNFKIDIDADPTSVNVVDIKNDLIQKICLPEIISIFYPGFPFEIPPVYFLEPIYDGKFTEDELITYQESAFDRLKTLRSIQIEQSADNNFISNEISLKFARVQAIYEYYTTQITQLKTKNIANLDKMFKKYTDKMQDDMLPDKQLYLNIMKDLEEFDTINVICRLKFYLSKVYDDMTNIHKINLSNLDTRDRQILDKCVHVWKHLIKKSADDAVALLEKEKAIFIENNPGHTIEVDEIDFVINVINNILNDVDFNKFKTPFELFCFCSPVLYSASDFVIDPYV